MTTHSPLCKKRRHRMYWNLELVLKKLGAGVFDTFTWSNCWNLTLFILMQMATAHCDYIAYVAVGVCAHCVGHATMMTVSCCPV